MQLSRIESQVLIHHDYNTIKIAICTGCELDIGGGQWKHIKTMSMWSIDNVYRKVNKSIHTVLCHVFTLKRKYVGKDKKSKPGLNSKLTDRKSVV